MEDEIAITDERALKKYATRNTLCRTQKGLKSVKYNCYDIYYIDNIYKYFLEIYAIKNIINDIVTKINNKELLTVERVKEIYDKYKQDIRYRKNNIEKIITHLETMQEQSEAPLEETKPEQVEAPPGGGRKRRSRKREIKGEVANLANTRIFKTRQKN